MPVLSIRHYETSDGRLADVTWCGSEDVQATVRFAPQLDRFDLEDLRWYHENYRENWLVSSNSVIKRIKHAELKIGKALHTALFHGDSFALAEKSRCAAPDLRIEIRDEAHGAAVPWELIADPETGDRFALIASSFVRVIGDEKAIHAKSISRTAHRLLLVISRPSGEGDVGYWSVAYRLWRELARLPSVKVDVLRPPTFEVMERRLDEAARSGTPYTAVHFDGHGIIVDSFGGARTRGYLLFETPGRAGPEFIDGSTIGQVLAAAGVLHFSMNACRSADSRSGDGHLRAEPAIADGQPSIVEDVLEEGVISCIGMRREIYPGTAMRFFGVFYPEFFGGRSAGEAASIARRRLHEEPLAAETLQEEIAPVDDWSIPVIGERAVVCLQNEPREKGLKDGSEQLLPSFPQELSAPAVIGFDRAVLALEDILAQAPVVLVHGPVLSGKSRLAVEYAKWLSATSPTPCPVRFVRLCASDTPGAVAARMLSRTMYSEGAVLVDPVECAGHLEAVGGILILDQADRIAPETEAFLGDFLSALNGACRVIVTARAESLSWLPGCRSVVPDALPRHARAELGRRWANANGVRFEGSKVHALLFFAGGFPGMVLLLLGAAHNLIHRGKASAKDITSWLHSGDWGKIADLASDPGPGLPSIKELIGGLVDDLSAICDNAELAMIRVLSRFHVCCDEVSAARLITAVSGTALSVEPASRVIGKLAATGLASRVVSAAEATWFLHPMLKLVASRLGIADPNDDDLEGAVIDTVSRKCADLAARFRNDTAGVVDMLGLYKQNMADAISVALSRGQLEEASHLTEGLCLYCRYVGDIDLSTRVLNVVLPNFIDTRTGMLRPECTEIGLRLWDQAIWLASDWPRRDPMRPSLVRLMPPDDDHYAAGLWLRAIGRMGNAAVAFRTELDAPAKHRRYAPGDIECQLSETTCNPYEPKTWPDALRESRRSYAARLPDDALGRAWSRIAEARVRLGMLFTREDNRVSDEDVTARIELAPEDLAALDEIAKLLRDAQSEAGSNSAENRSQAAMVWSRIMLARGDLTSSISYFEEGAEIMMAMEEASILHHYWEFALNLLHHGWVARSFETAVNAFQFAMQSGDIMLSTRIREFCQKLEATYPELSHDSVV